MKKVLSMAMAMMMAMSLVCTAFASSATNTLTRTSTLAGTYNAPDIKVTIPTTGKVGLNPYKLSYTVAENTTANDYICSATQEIKNESNVGVEISAVVTGKATNITLEKQSVKGENDADLKTTKSAYMYVVFADTSTALASATPVFTATDNATVNAILIQTTASKNTTVLNLGVGNTTATSGFFKIAGDIVSKPATAYTTSDKVDVTIAWTITPLVVASSSSSSSSTPATGDGE